jgi:hypothetical protein
MGKQKVIPLVITSNKTDIPHGVLLGLRAQVMQFASRETEQQGNDMRALAYGTDNGALVTDIVRPSNFEDRSTEKRDETS